MTDDENVSDIFDNLKTPTDVAIYIKKALDYGDVALAAAAIGDVTRFIGMAKIADKTGIHRESLYRTFSDTGNPRLNTLMAVLKAIGLKLSVEALESTDQQQ